MKILIDFTQIPLQKVGVGTYALNLVTQIYKLDIRNTYYIIAQDDDDSLSFITDSRFKLIRVKSEVFRRFIFRLLLEQIFIPFLVLKHRIGAVHSLHYSFPLFLPAKKIVTLHDMTVFKIPQRHMFLRVWYLKIFITFAAFFADKIITDSKSTLADFLHYFRFASKKAQMVYLGKDELYKPDLDRQAVERVKNNYGLVKKYCLFLGTIEPRKNVMNIILAFSKFLQESKDYDLVIAGRKGWHFNDVFQVVRELHLNGNVKFIGFVEEREKPYLISGAEIFIYPSYYEGFGIPVLEAIACGVPTITSNVSSLAEVAGDAALSVNPDDVDAIYGNMKKITENNTLRITLKQRSIEQAKKFSWEKMARETMRVYSLS